MAAAEKAGATSFAAMAKGAADSTRRLMLFLLAVCVYTLFMMLMSFLFGWMCGVVSLCWFALITEAFYMFAGGNCVGSHMVLHLHGNQAGVCDAFRLLH
jgi:hypothetical protein